MKFTKKEMKRGNEINAMAREHVTIKMKDKTSNFSDIQGFVNQFIINYIARLEMENKKLKRALNKSQKTNYVI